MGVSKWTGILVVGFIDLLCGDELLVGDAERCAAVYSVLRCVRKVVVVWCDVLSCV